SFDSITVYQFSTIDVGPGIILTMLLFYLLTLYLHVFFFTDPSTTEIYTLSLHDALPISGRAAALASAPLAPAPPRAADAAPPRSDRKSTRLNSSHDQISYAVFCLKKKNTPTAAEP